MVLLLLILLVILNVRNKLFWLIIPGSPPHYKRDGADSSVYILQKMGEFSFSSKMGEVGKIMEEGFLLWGE